MTNGTKNIISREMCKKDLIHLSKADIYSDIVILTILSLIFVPLTFLGIYILKYITILGIISIVVFATAPIYFICKLSNDIIILRLIKHDGFSVVTDTVSRLSKGDPSTKHSAADVIYFTNHGRYVPSQTTFDLSSLGDEFYLVVLHTKKKEPILVFHSLLYEYKDIEV